MAVSGWSVDWFARAWKRVLVRFAADADADAESASVVRYRMGLAAEIHARHAEAKAHMRALLDACRAHDDDAAVACLQQFARVFRQLGLSRSVLLCPYLRWGLQRDRVATLQFESVYRDLTHATLLIETILSDYLGTPWDQDRRRRFVHVVVRLASLFGQGIKLETTVLLPLYLPPGQYRHVADPAPIPAPVPAP